MKKIIFLILFLSYFQTFAECSLSTMPPNISPWNSQVSIEWRVKWACWEEPNEFKVYYQKNWNWFPVTTVLAWENQAKYLVDWDTSDVEDWDYKVRVLQSWDNTVYITSSSFTIDRIAPVIRNDVWILPTGWEVFRWKVILKWNAESVFDSYRLSDTPITLQYSNQWDDFVNIVEDIENSWVYVWDTSEINWESINLKIVAKDTFWNMNFNTLTAKIKIDNVPPSSITVNEINWEAIQNINYVSHTPLLTVWNIDSEDEPIKVFVYDINTEKVYFSQSWINEKTTIQLDPIKDWEYELVAVAVDSAWNNSETSNSINIVRDSFPPKAPKIKTASLIDWTMSVEVWSIDPNDKEWWELVLMNWNNMLRKQKSNEENFLIEMMAQWVYDLSVIHKDIAWNASDRSEITSLIFDEKPPQDVNIVGPFSIALYWDVDIKVSAIDNVWIKNFDILIDWESVWDTSDWDFVLKTKDIKNWPHKLKAVAIDYSEKLADSKEYDIRVFNSVIEDHWANNYIRQLFEDWYLSWESNSWIINPEWTMNRASALKFIMSVFWIAVNNDDWNSVFSDVDSRVWYWPYVKTAFENGKITWFQAKHKVIKIERSYDYANIYNLQFVLKWLWYNLEVSWVHDPKTIAAISNYQRYNWLRVSWSLWINTVALLNSEDSVKNWDTITDKFVYFKPWELVNRVQVLKMVLDFSWIELTDMWWQWYTKYTSYAKEKWVMTWDKSWNLMLEKPVNVWELSKIVLKVKDLLNDQ